MMFNQGKISLGVCIMEDFKKALDEAVMAFVKLSEEWEKIEDSYSDELAEKYPFAKDFREVVCDLINWKESLDD